MQMQPPVVLEAVGLHKAYGRHEALRDVSIEARAGERVACIGPNGAGKTTLLTILAGIQAADAGTVKSAPGRAGWVPQALALYSRLTVAENLRLFARLERVPDVEATVERMLEHAGLRDRAGERVEHLSGGNRQRVNVAIGLLADPPLLLMDEPSSALDPRQRERLWEHIAGLAGAGKTVVYATHTVSEAERYADRVLVLADGERLFWGAPDELARAVGHSAAGAPVDLESAFVAFLRQEGH
jgi:ABC-2 type transport system ATP-binding protein